MSGLPGVLAPSSFRGAGFFIAFSHISELGRVSFLIDGFNLYHALDYNPVHLRPWISPHRYKKYKWLNLVELCKRYALEKGDVIQDVWYFTALAYWRPDKVSRHQLYMRALQDQGVKIVHGVFKERTKHCNTCKQDFQTHEEKQTDVNIAVAMVTLAANDMCDKIILISGDSDILPAVELVKSLYSNKRVGVVVPIGKASNALNNAADLYYRMREKHLQQSQFADPHTLSDGSTIARPPTWK